MGSVGTEVAARTAVATFAETTGATATIVRWQSALSEGGAVACKSEVR